MAPPESGSTSKLVQPSSIAPEDDKPVVVSGPSNFSEEIAVMVHLNKQVLEENERLVLRGETMIFPQKNQRHYHAHIQNSAAYRRKMELKAINLDQHVLSVYELEQRYKTDVKVGLSNSEARSRLKRRGLNRITTVISRSASAHFMDFVFTPASGLVFSAMATLIIGFWLSTAKSVSSLWLLIPLACIVALLAFSARHQAALSNQLNNSSANLAELTNCLITVVREGINVTIPATELVPGDICLLKGNDRVPADFRLVSGSVVVDQSLLTCESKGIEKSTNCSSRNVFEAETLIFLGSSVLSGECVAMVIGCGDKSTLAKLACQTKEHATYATSLTRDISSFYKSAFIVSLILGIIFGLLGQWIQIKSVKADYSLSDRTGEILTMITNIILSAAPLLFPTHVTVGLSMFEKRLRSICGIFVSRLDIIPTLASVSALVVGSVDLLVDSDSRTIRRLFTCNKESVLEELTSPSTLPAAIVECLLQTAGHEDNVGDDKAIHAFLNNRNLFYSSRNVGIGSGVVSEPERVVVCESTDGEKWIRGPTEQVLAMCAPSPHGAAVVHMSQRLEREGETVIALAHRSAGENNTTPTLIALLTITNPIHPSARSGMTRLKRMGVKLIPGFHNLHSEILAVSILTSAGFFDQSTIPSRRTDDNNASPMSSGDRLGSSNDSFLFYDPVSPVSGREVKVSFSSIEKLRLVLALKRENTVGFIGSVSGDAAALRAASVGISTGGDGIVGRTADVRVTRSLNQTLLSVADAILQSRVCVNNLRKVIVYLISNIFPRIMPTLLSLAFGFPLPLSAVLIVTLAVVVDIPVCFGLLKEQPEWDVPLQPPRNEKTQRLISPQMMVQCLAVWGVLAFLSGFLGFFQVFSDYGFNPRGLSGITRASFVAFQTQPATQAGFPETTGYPMDMSLSLLENVHLCGRIGSVTAMSATALLAVPTADTCDGPIFTLDLYNQFCYSLNSSLSYTSSAQSVVSLFTSQKNVAGVLYKRNSTGLPSCGNMDYDGVFLPMGFYTAEYQSVVDKAMEGYTCAIVDTLGDDGAPVCFTNDAFWYGQTVYFASSAFFAILMAMFILRTERYSFFDVGIINRNWYMPAGCLVALTCVLMVVYVKPFHFLFQTRSLRASNLFTSSMPFIVVAVALEETRKMYTRQSTKLAEWLRERTGW